MITIIGTLLGLLGSLLPEVLKFWNSKEDHKHEIEMAKIQMEAQERLHTERMEEINTQADIAESTALYKSAEIKPSGIGWLDGIMMLYGSSVRPTVTYAFVAFYAIAKYAQYKVIVASGGAMWNTIWQLWNSEDMAVFATVLAFWFGGRFLKSSWQHYGGGTFASSSTPSSVGRTPTTASGLKRFMEGAK